MSAVEIRIVAGGHAEPAVEGAIREAVEQVLSARERARPARVTSRWLQAARLEGVGTMTVRSRAMLPPA